MSTELGQAIAEIDEIERIDRVNLGAIGSHETGEEIERNGE